MTALLTSLFWALLIWYFYEHMKGQSQRRRQREIFEQTGKLMSEEEYARWLRVQERQRAERERRYERELAQRMRDPASSQRRPLDWAERRAYILRRDGYSCQRCGGSAGLQVHHKRPVRESPNHSEDNLETLCVYCHAQQPGEGHDERLIESEIDRRCKRHYFKAHRSRKLHICENCQGSIEIGEYNFVKHGYGGYRICEECLLKTR